MNPELKAYLDEWQAEHQRDLKIMRANLDASRQSLIRTSDCLRRTSDCFSAPVMASSDTSELITASAGLAEPLAPAPTIATSLVVAPAVPIDTIAVLPATCSTECPSRDTPTSSPAAAPTSLMAVVDLIPVLAVAAASDGNLDGEATGGVASTPAKCSPECFDISVVDIWSPGCATQVVTALSPTITTRTPPLLLSSTSARFTNFKCHGLLLRPMAWPSFLVGQLSVTENRPRPWPSFTSYCGGESQKLSRLSPQATYLSLLQWKPNISKKPTCVVTLNLDAQDCLLGAAGMKPVDTSFTVMSSCMLQFVMFSGNGEWWSYVCWFLYRLLESCNYWGVHSHELGAETSILHESIGRSYCYRHFGAVQNLTWHPGWTPHDSILFCCHERSDNCSLSGALEKEKQMSDSAAGHVQHMILKLECAERQQFSTQHGKDWSLFVQPIDATCGLLMNDHSSCGFVILDVLVTWPQFSMDNFTDLASKEKIFHADLFARMENNNSNVGTSFSCLNGGLTCTFSVSMAGQTLLMHHKLRLPTQVLHRALFLTDSISPSHVIAVLLSFCGEQHHIGHLLHWKHIRLTLFFPENGAWIQSELSNKDISTPEANAAIAARLPYSTKKMDLCMAGLAAREPFIIQNQGYGWISSGFVLLCRGPATLLNDQCAHDDGMLTRKQYRALIQRTEWPWDPGSEISATSVFFTRFRPPKSYPLLDDMKDNNRMRLSRTQLLAFLEVSGVLGFESWSQFSTMIMLIWSSQFMALSNGGEQNTNFHELSLELISRWQHVPYTQWSWEPGCCTFALGNSEKKWTTPLHCYEQLKWSSLWLLGAFLIWLVARTMDGLEFSTCHGQAPSQGNRNVIQADLSDQIHVSQDYYIVCTNQFLVNYDYYLDQAPLQGRRHMTALGRHNEFRSPWDPGGFFIMSAWGQAEFQGEGDVRSPPNMYTHGLAPLGQHMGLDDGATNSWEKATYWLSKMGSRRPAAETSSPTSALIPDPLLACSISAHLCL